MVVIIVIMVRSNKGEKTWECVVSFPSPFSVNVWVFFRVFSLAVKLCGSGVRALFPVNFTLLRVMSSSRHSSTDTRAQRHIQFQRRSGEKRERETEHFVISESSPHSSSVFFWGHGKCCHFNFSFTLLWRAHTHTHLRSSLWRIRLLIFFIPAGRQPHS